MIENSFNTLRERRELRNLKEYEKIKPINETPLKGQKNNERKNTGSEISARNSTEQDKDILKTSSKIIKNNSEKIKKKKKMFHIFWKGKTMIKLV